MVKRIGVSGIAGSLMIRPAGVSARYRYYQEMEWVIRTSSTKNSPIFRRSWVFSFMDYRFQFEPSGIGKPKFSKIFFDTADSKAVP